MASRPPGHAFEQEFPALGDALRGQFHVERELGRGGMGVVYLARDERLDRMVALKVLPAALAAEPQTRERFLREARTAARLAHPNIVPVYRADEAGGSAYFAMAYVDGESLADHVRDRGPLPAADAVPPTRTRAAWCTATSNRRTSSSSGRRNAARGGRSSPTSASPTTRRPIRRRA
jgi:serine/threonine-protein kinase